MDFTPETETAEWIEYVRDLDRAAQEAHDARDFARAAALTAETVEAFRRLPAGTTIVIRGREYTAASYAGSL